MVDLTSLTTAGIGEGVTGTGEQPESSLLLQSEYTEDHFETKLHRQT